ncbi:hypothetical protein GCM10010250_31540 [Streptomyces althioticus]|nr:hypothetical protein GCM10010250_31540 [Streptomyces althioticus]
MQLCPGPAHREVQRPAASSRADGHRSRLRVCPAAAMAAEQRTTHSISGLSESLRPDVSQEEAPSAKTDKATWYVSKARAAPA